MKTTTRACQWCENRHVQRKGAKYCDECKPIAAKVHRNAIRARNKALRDGLLASFGCEDCGTTDPRKLKTYGDKRLNLTHSAKSIFEHVVNGEIRCYSCQAKRVGFGKDYIHEPGLPKPCTKCGKVKPLDQFPPQKRSKTGRHSWCHVCHRKSKQKRS